MDISQECRYRRWLKIILALYLLLALISTAATPLMRGPDEPAHVAYISNLAKLRFPQLVHTETRDPRSLESHEAHQPPLYYMISAVPFGAVEAITGDISAAVRTVRAVSLLIGLLWIYVVSLLVREFLGNTRKALYATAFTALIPMSSYLGGVVNNDILICLTFTWTLWILTGVLKRRELTSRAAVYLGLAVGLAVLSKAQGIFLIPLIVLAAFFARPEDPVARRKLTVNATLALLVTVLVSGWWFVRNILVYGEPVVQSLYHPVVSPEMLLADPLFALKTVAIVTAILFQFFWGPYWVVNIWAVHQPGLYIATAWPYLLTTVIGTLIGGYGLAVSLIRPAKDDDCRFRRRAYTLYLAAALLLYVSVVYQTLFIDRGVLQQGRLFLPLVGVLGIGMVEGFCRVFRDERARRRIAIAGIVGLLLLSMLFSFAVYYNYAFIEV